MQRIKRMQRGRPTKTDPPPMAQRYRVVVEVEAVEQAEDEYGWTVLATTVDSAVCTDAEIVQAYHDQHSTVDPGSAGSRIRRPLHQYGWRNPSGLRP